MAGNSIRSEVNTTSAGVALGKDLVFADIGSCIVATAAAGIHGDDSHFEEAEFDPVIRVEEVLVAVSAVVFALSRADAVPLQAAGGIPRAIRAAHDYSRR